MATVDFRAAVAEYVAMLLFVFLCAGSATGVANGTSQAAWVQQVALTFGFCITVLAYTIGHHSGGQINCAVTIGLVLVGELPVAQALVNFVAQVLGSVTGAALLALVKSEETDATGALGSNSLAPGIEWHQALVGEIVCTFLLMGTVLETAINHKSAASRPLAALAIGMSVYVAHSFLIPVDGCSINPTRSIGPAIVATIRVDSASAIWKHMWIFWVGPIVGAVLAVGLYKFMNANAPAPSNTKKTEATGEEQEEAEAKSSA